MLKIIGFLFILGSCTMAGFIYAETFKKRFNELNEIDRAFHQLENEILFTHTPLPRAFQDISYKTKEPISKIFSEISELLETGKRDNVYSVFKSVLKDNKEILNLNEQDVSIILDFSKTLGECDITGQERMFLLIFENLKSQIKNSKSLMDKNVKMYRYLGFFMGSMIGIIVI